MRVEEAGKLIGMTTKNIRFYEQEGLLSVSRSSINGYRDLSMENVKTLRTIKLFRKLGVPLGEIKRTLSGVQTAMDCMERHLVTMARTRRSLDQADSLCRDILQSGASMDSLDAEGFLLRMDQMEREGTSFMNVEKRDKSRRVIAPVLSALVMVLLMGGYIALMVWAFFREMPPAVMAVFIILLPLAVIVGVCIALIQRIKEIYKGEDEYDAVGKY